MQLFTCDHTVLTSGFVFDHQPDSSDIHYLLRLGKGIYPNAALVTLISHRPVTLPTYIVHKGFLNDVRGNKFADLLESNKDETQWTHQRSHPPILVCIRSNNFHQLSGNAVPGSFKTIAGKPLPRLIGVDAIDDGHFGFIETILQMNDGDITQISYGSNEVVLMHHHGFIARSSLLVFKTYHNPLSGMSEEFATSCQRLRIEK